MLKKRKNYVFLIFLLISIADIYAVATENKFLEIIFKPLLMPVLAMYYIASAQKINKWFLGGLFFSMLGDVFLLFQPQFFVLGLTSFLLAHIIYIKITLHFYKKRRLFYFLKASIPFFLIFIALIIAIKNNLNEMLLPVIVYGLVISAFGTIALANYLSVKSVANKMLFIGIVVFIASDSMIALHKFHIANKWYPLMIIITYIIAQYTICKAIVKKQKQ